MAGSREVAAGGCIGTGDGHGSCGKLSCSAGQSHGKVSCVSYVSQKTIMCHG